MTHITIETALLEQLVGALEVSKRWHNGDKYRYGKPQQRQAWTAQSGELDTAITAGRAALEGAERVRGKPAAYIVHRAMCEPYISYRKVKDALRNEPLYKEPQ